MAKANTSLKVSLLIFCAIVFGGCAKPFSARETSAAKLYRQRTTTALNSSELSESTQQKLRLMSLDKAYLKEPQTVARQLYQEVRRTGDSELMIAVAEMALLEARQLERKDVSAAAAMNLTAAALAYDYLFTDEQLRPSDALKPSYRFMADIYNMASSKLVENRAHKEDPWTDQSGIKAFGTTYDLKIRRKGCTIWNPNVFDSITAANEIKIGGFRNAYFSKGLGAPMVGYVDDPRSHADLDTYFPVKGAAFAVTALLDFGQPMEFEFERRRTVELAFYNSVLADHTLINGTAVPLEADYTTPLAVLMSRIQAPDQGLQALFKSNRYIPRTGMRMLQPWQADKIPVVMVHGLMSTPETWLDMFNDLTGDPQLRRHYQFWLFAYPTGLPIIYSASLLRDTLRQMQTDFASGNPDSSFRNMVLIGHSMGGLLSRLMIQDSGSRYWDNIFADHIDQIALRPADKEFLANILFFDRLPFVDRVIFIATPHRGSKLADRFLARIGSGFVSLPGSVDEVGDRIMQTPEGELAFDPQVFHKRVPNSIDLLSPSSRFLRAMQDVPFAPGVPYHSIIGIRNAADGPGSSDGVVPYASSHLETAVSEKLVASDHAAHKNAQAIAEVKRILWQHLRELQKEPVAEHAESPVSAAP